MFLSRPDFAPQMRDVNLNVFFSPVPQNIGHEDNQSLKVSFHGQLHILSDLSKLLVFWPVANW